MNPIQPFLDNGNCLILDGGLATELEARGHELNNALWSADVLLKQPQAIRDVHLDYLKAGANCLITASYQATFQGFAERGLSRQGSRQLLNLTVELAHEARELYIESTQATIRPLIAASIGPYAAYLADGSEYTGVYDKDAAALADFHRERWHLLAASNADLLACETIPNRAEMYAFLELLRETPSVYAWLSFACKDDMSVSDGSSLRENAGILAKHPQVIAIGINCTAPRHLPSLIGEIRKGAPDKPIVVYPNSGERYDATSKTWNGDADVIRFGKSAKRWRAAGASLIGGCCRTGPAHITALRENLT